MSLIRTSAAIILSIGMIEAAAYWWMHPSSGKSPSPVITYVPNPNNGDTEYPKVTPLPALYSQSAPMLRCTGGKVWHVQQNETVGLHVAFFEWDGTDTGSVLEAFRHAPEACMGSIGMKVISREKPITYFVQVMQGTKEPTQSPSESSSKDQRSKIKNQPSSISPSRISSTSSPDFSVSASTQTLVFEHTIFQEQAANARFPGISPKVHAFRAVWVAGREGASYRDGIDGDNLDQLTTIRIKSTLSRYRPTNARVIQGAVRGAVNGEAAWKAFEQSLLINLDFK